MMEIAELIQATSSVVAAGTVHAYSIADRDDYELVYDAQLRIENPDVTMLVIAFNKASYIEECVESIVRQKTQTCSFEIVIADDKSTDGTFDKAMALQKKYPRLISVVNPRQNIGFVPNFLRALRLCRGRYACAIDGDDYYPTSDKIERQVSILEANPDVVMTYAAPIIQFKSSRWLRYPISMRTRRYLNGRNTMSSVAFAKDTLKATQITAGSAMFRCEPMMEVAGRVADLFKVVSWVPCQDFETWSYLALKGRVHFSRELSFVYRYNETSMSGRTSVDSKQLAYHAARNVADDRVRLAVVLSEPALQDDETITFHVARLLDDYACWHSISDSQEAVPDTLRNAAMHLIAKIKPETSKYLLAGETRGMANLIVQRKKRACRNSIIHFALRCIAAKVFPFG